MEILHKLKWFDFIPNVKWAIPLELHSILKTELGDYKIACNELFEKLHCFLSMVMFLLWCFSFTAWPDCRLLFETQSHHDHCLLPQTTSHSIRSIILEEELLTESFLVFSPGNTECQIAHHFWIWREVVWRFLFYLCGSSQQCHGKHISPYKTWKWLQYFSYFAEIQIWNGIDFVFFHFFRWSKHKEYM